MQCVNSNIVLYVFNFSQTRQPSPYRDFTFTVKFFKCSEFLYFCQLFILKCSPSSRHIRTFKNLLYGSFSVYCSCQLTPLTQLLKCATFESAAIRTKTMLSHDMHVEELPCLSLDCGRELEYSEGTHESHPGPSCCEPIVLITAPR